MNPLKAKKHQAQRRARLQWVKAKARTYDLLILRGDFGKAATKAARKKPINFMLDVPKGFRLGSSEPLSSEESESFIERHSRDPKMKLTEHPELTKRVLVGPGVVSMDDVVFYNCEIDCAKNSMLLGNMVCFERCAIRRHVMYVVK